MRLHRHAVLRSQHVEIERGQNRRGRSARRLMAADLQAVGVVAQMIGVVDRPARQPEHLALERGENLQRIGRRLWHRCARSFERDYPPRGVAMPAKSHYYYWRYWRILPI